MSLSQEADLSKIFRGARELAAKARRPLTSAYLILAFFTVPNDAEQVLFANNINEDNLLAHFDPLDDADVSLGVLRDQAVRSAEAQGSDCYGCLHLLAAMIEVRESAGHRLLARVGVPLTQLYLAVKQKLCALAEEETNDTEASEAAGNEALDTVEAYAIERDTLAENANSNTHVGPERRKSYGRRSSDREAAEAFLAAKNEKNQPVEHNRRADDARRSEEVRANLEAKSRVQLPEAQSPYLLRAERFPILHKLGRNLSHLAYLGKLDPVFGRNEEIDSIVDILNKRRSNNPCLLGEPGVGKTAVAEGLAQYLVREHQKDPRHGPPERVVIELESGSLLAGTHLRGALSERLRSLLSEVRDAQGHVIIFFDEIHALLSGEGEGTSDAAQELKTALSRGEFPCIGATTYSEYRSLVDEDPALERRFTPVVIEEPTEAETLHILEGQADIYARHHRVKVESGVLPKLIKLGRRYIHDRFDPDRSLSILDHAGAIARRSSGVVNARVVAEVISRKAGVPVEHLMVDNPTRFLEMETHLKARIAGQDHVLQAIAETLRRSLAGFSGKRPMGSLLFLGSTGVGKTEVVKVLAEFLFGSRDAMTRFDMSEYLEAHTIARLIGAPPGYVGFGEGGLLTDAVRRRPYQILLFDEIEKSHRDIWNLLLQLLEEGEVTDSKGRTVDFSNTVVVLTSNVGAKAFGDEKRMGFGNGVSMSPEQRRSRALSQARESFPPELWNRIESRLVFNPLGREDIARIAGLIAADRSALLEGERGISFELTESAISYLIEHGGFEPSLGARPMRQVIAREVETPLAAQILSGQVTRGDHLQVVVENDHIAFHTQTLDRETIKNDCSVQP